MSSGGINPPRTFAQSAHETLANPQMRRNLRHATTTIREKRLRAIRGPARWRIRVCPISARWRTAVRAPRYWSMETMTGLRRAVDAATTTGMLRSRFRTSSSTSTCTTTRTRASTRCRSSPSITARIALGSSGGTLTDSTE